MFYVINKSKVYSYIIAVCTVVILFVAAANFNDAVSPTENVVETGANIVENNNLNHQVEKNNMINE